MKKNKTISEPTPATVEAPKAVETSESEAPAKKRRFTRRTLIKILFVISVIFIMISLTYSWFSYSNNANVNGLDIQVTDPNNLVAGVIAAKGQINTVAGNGSEFFKPQFEYAAIGEVSADGYQLYKNVPKKDANGVGLYQALNDDVISDTAVVENVLIQDFSLNIKGSYAINMIKGTSVSVANENFASLNSALRVAILKFDKTQNKYVPLLVWVPYSDTATVVYSDPTDNAEGADGISEAVLTTEDDEFGDVKYYWGEIDEDTVIPIGTVSGTQKYRCVVWLDGNDANTNDYSILGESVTIKLKFLPEGNTENATDETTDETDEDPSEEVIEELIEEPIK